MKKILTTLAVFVFITTNVNAKTHNLIGGSVTDKFPSSIFTLLGPAKCTSTKIAPKTYITAAHCLTLKKLNKNSTGLKRTLLKGDMIFLSKASVVSGFKDFSQNYIDEIFVHPSYDHFQSLYAKKEMEDWKAASLSLDTAIFSLQNEEKDVKIASLDYSYIGQNERVSVLGYGCEVRFGEKAKKPIARKKIGVKTSSSVFDDRYIDFLSSEVLTNLEDNFIYSEGLYTKTEKVSICAGDSGGPLLREGKVVGTVSFAYADDFGKPYNNFFTRLSKAKDWVIENSSL